MNVFIKSTAQSNACMDSVMTGKGRTKSNIFIKSTAQSNACTDSLMTGKGRMKSNFITRVITLLFILLGITGQTLADTSTVTASKVTFSSVTWTGSGGETWSVSVTGGATNQNVTNSYAQIGTKNSPSSSITLRTSGISGTITSVVINCASYQGKGTVSTTVGGSDFGTQSQGIPAWSNDTGGDVTFSGSASGSIDITMTNGSGGRAMYIKSITVTYTTGGGSLTPSDFTLTSSASVSIDMKDATTSAVTWTSSSTESVTGASNHDDVAKFEQTGPGTGTITAYGTGNCTITLNQAASSTIDAGTATIYVTVTRTKDDSDLTVTGSISLTIPTSQVADITDAYTTSSTGTMTYSASDEPSVALINSDGRVVAVGAGTAHITISQEADDSYLASENKTVTVNVTGTQPSNFAWDLRTNSYSSASATQVVWSNPKATMTVDKNASGTNANNYLGGDANNHTSSRFYTNSTLTFSPVSGYEITAIKFSATTSGYAAALANSTWTNAVAAYDYDTQVVVIIPTDGTQDFSAEISGTTGHTEARIYYTGKTDIATLNSISPSTLVTGQTGTFTLDADYATSAYTVTWESLTPSILDFSGSTFTAATAGNVQVRVTVTPDDLSSYDAVNETYDITIEDPYAYFDNSSVILSQGERAKQLVHTNSQGTVTYSSNSTNATVDSSTGEVTAVAVSDEPVTITATVAAWSGVAQQTASYTVTITPPASYTYEKVTTIGVPPMGVYLIVNEESKEAMNGALESESFKISNNKILVTFDDDDAPTKIMGTDAANAGYIIIRPEEGGKYSMKAAAGYYFGYDGSSSGGNMNTNSASNSYNTTITINASAEAVIRGSNGSGYTLLYNTSAHRFAFYGTEQEPVALYRRLLTDPTASFAKNMTLELGDTDRQTVTTNSDGTVTYRSSDPSIATVDASGNVTAVGAGTATITADIDFTSTYSFASASYTVTVSNPSGDPVLYGTEADVAVVAVHNTTKFIAMRTTVGDSNNRMTAKDVTDKYSDGNVLIASVADFAKSEMDIRWTKKETNTGKLKLQKPGTSNYLQGNSSTNLTLNTTATEWTWDSTNEYYYTTLSSTNRSFLYNGTVFRNFAVSNIGNSGYSEAAALHRFQYTYDKYNRTSTPTTKPAYTGGPILPSNAIAVYTPESDDVSKLNDFKDNANVVINGTAQNFVLSDYETVADQKIYNSFYAPTSFTTASKVSYSRPNAGGWNSVCLPFSIPYEKVTALFGGGAKVYQLTAVNASSNVVFTELTDAMDPVPAGEPILVYSANDTWNATNVAGTFSIKGDVAGRKTVTSEYGTAEIIGTYSTITPVESDGSTYYKLKADGSSFGTMSATAKVYPFRMYIKFTPPAASPAPANLPVKIHVIEGTIGDLNKDKMATLSDLTKMINMVNGAEEKTNAADLDGDGDVNGVDVNRLAKILVKSK